MPDRIVTATALDGSFAIIAGVTSELVRETQSRHELAPTASAALGRLLTGAVLLGARLKGRERFSLQIAGDGPLRGMTADVSLRSQRELVARGYARNGAADLPLNAHGKFDVAGVVGQGRLQITRSFEVGQPYVGVVPLVSGEIGEDIAGYLAHSEQIPSIVALGVLAGPNGIRASGGIVANVMPGASGQTIAHLEARVGEMQAVTAQIDAGASAEDLARSLAGDLALRFTGEFSVAFGCRCSRRRVERALLGLAPEELAEMANDRKPTEAVCEYCKERYVLTRDEVASLAARVQKGS